MMGNQATSWYIPGEGKQPTGPFTAEQLFQAWQAGRLSDTTMCWREGMTRWLPLAQVEPFASAIRSAGGLRHAMPETVRAGASPKQSRVPLMMVYAGAGIGVALLAIVVGVLATRSNGGGGPKPLNTGAADAEPTKPPVADAPTTAVAPDGPLAGRSGEQVNGRLSPDDAKVALQGVWVAESVKTGGKELPADAFKHVLFTFQGDRLVVWLGFLSIDPRGPEKICTYSVDPKQSPKHLNFTPQGETTPNLGIYDLKGDRLTVCFHDGGSASDRPTTFAVGADWEHLLLIVLKKQKPEEQRELLAQWIKQTKDEDRHSRLEGIVLLARMAAESKAARDALAEALRDKDKEMRSVAATALSRNAVLQTLFKAGADSLPVLREVVRNGDSLRIDEAFAKAPDKVGVDAIPALIEILHDREYQVRMFGAIGLAKVGRPAIPALTEALGYTEKDDPLHSSAVRSHAAWAFLLMGSEAKPALPALKETLRDRYFDPRLHAALALARIGPEGVTILVEALRDKDPNVCAAGFCGLGGRELLSTYDRFYVSPGATALGPEAHEAIPILIEALNERNSPHRISAVQVLGSIGPPARAAVPGLVQFVEEGNRAGDGIWALGQIGPGAAEAVPALTKILDDPKKHWLYPAVVKALGQIGPAAAEAVPALKRILDDRRKNFLYATTTEAIRKIESPGSQPPESLNGGTLKEIAVDLGGGVKLEMVLIPAGEFLMGTPGEFGGEMPQHRVRITRPFYLGKYLVTQEQWEAVMGSNPSEFKGPKNPVEHVSWDDCQTFLAKLTADTGGQQGKFVLPTEAQWEYACRAGSTTKYCFGDDARQLGAYGWYVANSERKTHPVGQKKPNAWGLYDMHGNVGEWCADWDDNGRYDAVSPTDDPTGPNGTTGWLRVRRGGSWLYSANRCRSASRTNAAPGFGITDLGLRVSLVPADNGPAAPSPIIESPRRPGASGGREVRPVTPPADDNPLPKGPLSGTWQASGGARFRIEDDGTALKIKLSDNSGNLRELRGTLDRAGEQNRTECEGTLEVTFQASPRRFTVRTKAVLDGSDTLRVHCSDWPLGGGRTQVLDETWTRQQQ